MKIQLRRQAIVDVVNELGNISFSELKLRFPDISDITLRRDLEALDAEQRVIRIHGGVKSVELVIGTDDLFTKRVLRNGAAKKLIASKAAKLVKPNLSIYLDSGSTTTELASIFPNIPCLLYTNSITCAMELSKLDRPEVFVIGGRLNRFSQCTNGTKSLDCLEDLNFDLAIMGTTGYASGRGFSCGVEEEYMLKREAIRHAEKIIMLMDSKKVGFTSTYSTARVSDVDILVTDDELPEDIRAELLQSGVELI